MWKASLSVILLLLVPEWTSPQKICKFHDVVEYLNISSQRSLLSSTVPTKNWREPLTVDINLALVSILSVVEKLQIVSFYISLVTVWKNDFLSWDPEDFCNITSVTLPVKQFWVPDICFSEQIGEDKAPKMPYLVLYYEGTMVAADSYQLILGCNLDINKFPFDSQTCKISVSLWLNTAKEVKLRFLQNTTEATKQTLEHHLSSGEWNFTKINVTKQNLTEDEGYSTIIYEISMTRRPVLHMMNLLLPTSCFLLMDISISSIRENYGDKISFKITLILGVSVLSLILNEILPITSTNPPLIAIFFTGTFMFLIAGLLEVFFLLYLKDKPQHPLSRLMNQIFTHFKRDKKKAKTLHDSDLVCIPNEPLGEQLEARNFSPIKGDSDEIILLKKIHLELQLIEQQMAPMKSQDPAHIEWASVLAALEKGLFYIHTISVISFCIILALKWTSTN